MDYPALRKLESARSGPGGVFILKPVRSFRRLCCASTAHCHDEEKQRHVSVHGWPSAVSSLNCKLFITRKERRGNLVAQGARAGEGKCARKSRWQGDRETVLRISHPTAWTDGTIVITINASPSRGKEIVTNSSPSSLPLLCVGDA